ncbi:BON domain-containing protein [Halopseudomonas maritima]|uniref:BON domain-containing protein n=1 Tax=Halopseudomonas maritima TaxID=2918528 RepID=UPI001EEC0705|nr:BON domain-containing protein [Halopseudomonas maritima]UJJ33030.1 BON domain-containing protein [Halopseudomonas maritima]
MNKLKTIAIATATASVLSMSPLAAHADDGDLTEARQEGSIWTAITLNRHLNPFSIDVDVENGVATLTGDVESDVDRDLAEQVAKDIEGIQRVDNQLTVNPDAERKESAEGNTPLSTSFSNATTTATIKSKLLWNSNTEGLDIDVTTNNGVVTLSGTAQSDAAKDLAGMLAKDTDGVHRVDNEIRVNADATAAAKAQNAADDAGEAISDAWITSKIKSSYLLSSNLSGLDISVDTKNGVVTLSGTVMSSAEKDLAIQTAENIKGVKEVTAENLRTAS